MCVYLTLKHPCILQYKKHIIAKKHVVYQQSCTYHKLTSLTCIFKANIDNILCVFTVILRVNVLDKFITLGFNFDFS